MPEYSVKQQYTSTRTFTSTRWNLY